MKTGGILRGFVAILAVVGVLGGASAEEAGGATAPAAEAEPTTPAQMVTAAKGMLPAMDRSATVVRRQLTMAREQKDVVKALCLNDKLNQIDLAIRTANDRVTDLENAASANDVDRSRHQFTVVEVLRDRVTTLVSEANQCIGEETGFVGESAVTVEVEDVPDTDPSQYPRPGLVNQSPIASEPAPPASPSMPVM